MELKPQTFFIGVIDFFSVLLPGGLLTYFLMGMFYGDVFGSDKIFPEPDNYVAKWIAFLIATYGIGNIIYLLAAFLDKSYDKLLRKRFFQTRYDLSYKTARVIRGRFIDTDGWLAQLYSSAQLSGDKYSELLNDSDREIFNTFKWCQHYLQFNDPEVLYEIKRIEADSKFFRSLVITFLIIAILLLFQAKFIFAFAFIVFAGLCYYRFGDLRFKATEKAYQLIITKYCIQPQQNIVTGTEISSTVIKQELTKEFKKKYNDRITFLLTGITNPKKQLSIAPGSFSGVSFTNDTDDIWCCVSGKCTLEQIVGNEKVTAYLLPGALLPVRKGTKYSFEKIFNEPFECIIVNY